MCIHSNFVKSRWNELVWILKFYYIQIFQNPRAETFISLFTRNLGDETRFGIPHKYFKIRILFPSPVICRKFLFWIIYSFRDPNFLHTGYFGDIEQGLLLDRVILALSHWTTDTWWLKSLTLFSLNSYPNPK